MRGSIITAKERLEFTVVWLVVHLLGAMHRGLARWVGARIGMAAYFVLGRLRATGLKNLALAFPEKPEQERDRLLREEYRNLGYQLAEFCLMPRYSREDVSRFVRYEGLENYEHAKARGRGVLVLTGHLGAWELSSFYHSLMGRPMGMVIRRLDNPLVDDLVNRIRCLHGNRILHKDDFARGLIAAMRAGETVGILMDTNMTPPQGVFVPFFGIEACTASGMARLAARTGAAVVPGFLLRDGSKSKYVLHFGEEVDVQLTGEAEVDARRNTALFTSVIERYVRAHADQWLWMHRRWKTRPDGEKGIY